MRLDKLGCPFPEVADAAEGGMSSGLLSGLPSRELRSPAGCSASTASAGCRRALSPDGSVLAEVTLSG